MSLSSIENEIESAISTHGNKLVSVYMKLHLDVLNTNADISNENEESVRKEVVELIRLKLKNTHSPFAKNKSKKGSEQSVKLKALLSKPAVKSLGLTWIAGKYHPSVISKAKSSLENAEKHNENFNGLHEDTVDEYSRRVDALESAEQTWTDAAKSVEEFVNKKKDLSDAYNDITELEEIDWES